MDTEISIRDAMTRKVLTLDPDASVKDAAELMEKAGIGSVVISREKPVGIVTERDICYHVVAKDKRPTKVKLKEIMSSPLKTITSAKTLTDASRIMVKYNIRRLPVVEDENLVGIISNKDIVAIAPETIEILRELSKINSGGSEGLKEVPERGTCERCGDYMVTITELDGTYVCESCKEDIAGGE